MPDKFNATWISHSSISDYLECPRAYFLKNVYKDSHTNRKVTVITPSLALGQAVHATLEQLSVLPQDRRITGNLMATFHKEWERVSGKRGGFLSTQDEARYKNRGEEMIRRVYNHPGPLERKAVKVQKDLLWYWLSEAEEIILCGKIDWMEYLPAEDAVHIIDFKTGQHKQDGSLQLPIYYLLAKHSQKRTVLKMSYWYVALEDMLTPLALPDEKIAHHDILTIGRKMKLARQLKKFDCPTKGCRACAPFERVVSGEAELVGQDDFGRDMYMVPQKGDEEEAEEIIL